MDLESRIDRLRYLIKKNNFDAVAIFSDENRRYLSGFTAQDGNYDESAGFLIITEKDLVLATDSRYKLQAQNEAKLYSTYCYEKGLSSEFPDIINSLNYYTLINKNITLAIETSRITFELYNKIEQKIKERGLKVNITSSNEALKEFRIIKEPEEVNAIRSSLKIAEDAFLKLKTYINTELTEKEAAWLLEKFIRESGADCLSFPVIAASGTNSALPHAIPENRRFRKGGPLLFDFGAKFNGYCSDISRTIVIGGEPDNTFKEAYETVLHAQNMAIKAIRPKIKCSEIDKIAREYIDNSKFKGKFGHALGHGVGIAIHEPPRLSRLDETNLEAGMVVTVEPGIYIPEWGGIRLENMVLVTENGAEVLNTIGYDDYIV
ncbi:MAG: aminopeptidase P family protein [Desulfamplus sp.]|nr:aminopeptidase P family protein [Desulfamplus sp.]